jgi:cell division protein FtsX
MRNTVRTLALAALIAVTVPAITVTAVAAEAAAKAKASYDVNTTLVGTLLDDPAANEVLKKMIPSVYSNEMFQTMGRDQTLKNIQQYEPEALSDENLKKVQAELAKLPAKG